MRRGNERRGGEEERREHAGLKSPAKYLTFFKKIKSLSDMDSLPTDFFCVCVCVYNIQYTKKVNTVCLFALVHV